ncbi:sugar phosphate isomerase/epimerase family protein [Paenibacillus thalictri]|nr:sugar phosphate isomerase/epimerase [Paenibacillus thalictri]
MYRLGMPTLVELESINDQAELCKELALDFVELNMNVPLYLPDMLSADRLIGLKRQFGIDFTVHLPEELDIASFQTSIREGHMNCCKEAIRWAGAAQIETLNMHLNNGIYFTLPDQRVWINERYEDEFKRLLLASYRELWRYAEEHRVKLCIENTGNFHIPLIRRALDALSVNDNFYLTWDAGHDAKAGFKELAFFTAHVDRIRHMHLHDMNEISDHQPLYSGKVPVNDRLRFAYERGLSVVIEIKTAEALRQSVALLKQRFVYAQDPR